MFLPFFDQLRAHKVPVSMRERSGGVPSARRLRLVFNFLRLLVGVAGGVLVGRRDGGRR